MRIVCLECKRMIGEKAPLEDRRATSTICDSCLAKRKGKMREIKKIIVHCSDSTWGDADVIDKWHKERGWSGIGYHFVIANGVQHSSDEYDSHFDGLVQPGRGIKRIGAHCRGENRDSIGICLIGKYHFSMKQLLVSLPSLLFRLCAEYDIRQEHIYGHNDFSNKACPGFNVNQYLTKL